MYQVGICTVISIHDMYTYINMYIYIGVFLAVETLAYYVDTTALPTGHLIRLDSCIFPVHENIICIHIYIYIYVYAYGILVVAIRSSKIEGRTPKVYVISYTLNVSSR